jgi:protein-disulfide isomerase
MTKRKSRDVKSTQQTASASAVKSRTKARREARESERRRRRNITYVLGFIALGVVIAAVAFLITRPQDAPIPDGTFDRYEGIPQSVDENGFPTLGDPDALVRVIEYSSFSCPACRSWHEDNFDRMIEQIRAGVVHLTFIPLQAGGVPNPAGAARVALCAGEQGLFFEMHDALFDWQGRYGNRAFTQQRLDTGVENFNLNRDQFNQCRGSSVTGDILDAAEAISSSRGATSTPSFSVQGTLVSQGALFDTIETTLQNVIATTGRQPIPLSERSGTGTEVEVTPEPTEVAEPEITEEPTSEVELETTPEATETSGG